MRLALLGSYFYLNFLRFTIKYHVGISLICECCLHRWCQLHSNPSPNCLPAKLFSSPSRPAICWLHRTILESFDHQCRLKSDLGKFLIFYLFSMPCFFSLEAIIHGTQFLCILWFSLLWFLDTSSLGNSSHINTIVFEAMALNQTDWFKSLFSHLWAVWLWANYFAF